ncbi:histone-lysine N-methyltransferase SETMAR-like [Euwallacea similis]|uniref:histone-lysine N-methyltransferase SETMAR-like n=1 Tax=Euwallacea similis TaxID=1736056 RepID=UPI00344C208F
MDDRREGGRYSLNIGVFTSILLYLHLLEIGEKMKNQKLHLRHLLLHYYHKGKNAVQATKKICAVCAKDTVSERTVREWFVKFRGGEFNLEDRQRSGRPSSVDDDQIKVLITQNPRSTTHDTAQKLKVSNSTIYDHLMRLNFVGRLDVWVLHELSERNLMDHISIAKTFVGSFLCAAVNRPKDQSSPKESYALLLRGLERYCTQLNNLEYDIEQLRPEFTNRKGVVFHQDNA